MMADKTIYEKMAILKEIFDVVRLVDTVETKVITVSESGEISEGEYQCFSIWNKERRCDNCISAQAFATKGELTKFEFRGDQVYFIMAKYIVVNDRPFVLEMGKVVNDKTLFGAYPKDDFIDKITQYTKKIYTDSLTGCYNRRYFDEQLMAVKNITAVAILDIDDFKEVNDTYGHIIGDVALRTMVNILVENVRHCDSVIRMGGDEFVIAFQDMKKEMLYQKLTDLREKLEKACIPECPELHITISAGGYYCGQYDDDSIKVADRLLYEAKKGKNTLIV